MYKCVWAFSNISSETTGLIAAKFHLEPPLDRGTKVCSNDPGHMTNGARWLSGRMSDSGARGRGFETYRRRAVSLSKTFTPRKYWLITQEAVAPSRHDWKIVDWDFKPQHKQTIWPPCLYMVKTLKKILSGTKRPMTLKLDMQHQILEYYQVCSNDDPGLTLIFLRQGQICSPMRLYGNTQQ